MDESGLERLTETVIESDAAYRGLRVNVRVDKHRMADGREATREVVEHPDSVVVLALREDGMIPFVRQWRAPAEGILLELPAGMIDPGEEPEAAARRELREEVGLDPAELEPLPAFYVAPGWATERLFAYIARGCVDAPLPPDDDEELLIEWLTLGQAMQLGEAGEIIDAKSLVLLQALALQAIGPLGRKVVHHYRGERL